MKQERNKSNEKIKFIRLHFQNCAVENGFCICSERDCFDNFSIRVQYCCVYACGFYIIFKFVD
jgi:hypothetical protein